MEGNQNQEPQEQMNKNVKEFDMGAIAACAGCSAAGAFVPNNMQFRTNRANITPKLYCCMVYKRLYLNNAAIFKFYYTGIDETSHAIEIIGER